MQFSLPLGDDQILAQIRARLVAAYGAQRDELGLDPLTQLVHAMVSYQTKDETALAACERLSRRYPDWAACSAAEPTDIERLIRPVTFADKKARDIPRALRMIVARTGGLDLDFLAEFDEEAAMQWLTSLPGIGTKTAATALNFSFLRKRILPVDMDLLHLGARLGLMRENTTHDNGYDAYMRLIADEWTGDNLYELHWLLKYHSQDTCNAKRPACQNCVLYDLCPSAEHRSAATETAGADADLSAVPA